MKIGLIDVDGHNFPNLALMKLSAWHKAKGDTVEWCLPFDSYNIIYQAKVFDETYSADIDCYPSAERIIKGGTGYVRRVYEDKTSWLELYVSGKWIKESEYDNSDGEYREHLPDDIEHIYPDYDLYPALTKGTAYGFLTRGCPNNCDFCIVSKKEGRCSVKVADLNEFWRGQKHIKLLDPNILACKKHMELLQQLADSKAYVDFTQGLDIRLVNDANVELINKIKVKEIHFAWDNPDMDLKPKFEFYKQIAKHKPHGEYGTVYCLTNHGSTIEEDLYRIYTLRDLGYNPYVMIFDKPNAPKDIKRLQRWCNNRYIFKSCQNFEDYK